MALEEKVSTLPITGETGLLIKETLLSCAIPPWAARTLLTADPAPASAAEATLRKEAKLTPSTSPSIAVRALPTFFAFQPPPTTGQ